MASARNPLLSFTSVYNFLSSYQQDSNDTVNTFKLIAEFLQGNEQLLTDVSAFTKIGSINPKATQQLSLRGTVYKVSTKNCEDASSLSASLRVNYEEALRVLSQTDARITSGENKKDLYAQQILQERNAVLDTALLLINNTQLPEIGDYYLKLFVTQRSNICAKLMELLSQFSQQIKEVGATAEPENPGLSKLKLSQDLAYIANVLRLLSILFLNSQLPTALVVSWFTLLKDTNYFLGVVDDFEIPGEVAQKLEALTTVNTLLVLGLDTSFSTINIEAPFFKDIESFKFINEVLTSQPNNSVILYYWSFVLYMKSYLFEEFPEENVEFVKSVFGSTSISSLVAFSTSKAEQLGVFKALENISLVLSPEKLYSVILTSFTTLSLNFISITTETTSSIKKVLLNTPREFIEKFLTNDEFEKKLVILRAKLPLLDEALLPMLNLTSTHPEFAHFEWKDLNTYTERMKLGDIDYDLAEDESIQSEGTDLIVLKKEILVKPPMESDKTVLLPMPKDTRAKIIPLTSNDEDAIVFLYSYNGWSLLGRMLQNICDNYLDTNDEPVKLKRREILIAIIDLITQVVGKDTPIERSTEILQHLSGYVSDDDIVSVIFKIFEQALQFRDFPVLCSGLKLLVALIPNFSHFVWSYLARSGLIARNGKGGLAATILGTTELTNGKYDFTIILIELVNQLVTESVTLETDFPDRMKKDILGRFTSHLLNVYESYQYWKYTSLFQRFKIGSSLTSLFTNILYSVYGIDPTSPPTEKITKVLAGSANSIVSAFLASQSSDIRAVNSLLSVLTSLKSDETVTLTTEAFGNMYMELVTKTFELANLIISVRALLKMPPSTLEKHVYAKSPDLVDVYVSYHHLRNQVIKLLTYLVRAPWSNELPSLLAHLGQTHSRLLLDMIASDLESPLCDHRLMKNLYSFFSSIMEGKQDGLSILFLTGKVATCGDQSREEKEESSKSILAILKNNALRLDDLSESVGSHLLDAIAFAFNTWTSARNYDADKELISALVKKLQNFKPKVLSKESTTEEIVSLSNEYKLISRIAEICALYLFTSLNTNSPIFELLNRSNLASAINPLFQIDGYNNELHRGLQVEFEGKWPKLKLSKFTLSPLFRSSTSFQTSLYDITLMDQFFGADEQWIGTTDNLGFRDKVIEASINLQFVTYQVSAAKSWGALLTSFVKKTPVPLGDTFIDVISHFLKINLERGIGAPLFADVYLERIELTFYVLYSFLMTAKTIPEDKLVKILIQLMDMMKAKEINFLENVPHSKKSNYFRPLMRSVLIVLSLVKSGTHFIELVSDQLLEFFELTFSRGVNLVLSEILSEINTSSSNAKTGTLVNIADRVQDLLLLLSLFTKIKQMKPPSSFSMVLASSLNEVGTLKAILNLYSSSHLFKLNEEPILADITLTYISELSSVDYVAEKLVTNGLFSVLLESPISVAIQSGNLKPEFHPRIHSIWSNGLLSIILQLISQFGSKILPECCLFVTYFSRQLSSTIFGWSDSSLAVSNAVVQETSQIILLQKMLGALDYQQFLTNSNVKTKVINDTEVVELVPGLDTNAERRELSAVFNHLLTHPKFLNSRIVPTTLEEQRLLEDDEMRVAFVKKITNEIRQLQELLFSEEL